MIPGPDYIYKCPNCGSLFRQGSLTSGNTFGAKVFSDGVTIAPMMSDFPSFTKCKKCGSFLNMRELKEVGIAQFNYHRKTGYDSIKWENISLQMKYMLLNREDIPKTIPLEKSDFYKALEMFPEYELGFRLQIWRSSNEALRVLLEGGYPIPDSYAKYSADDKPFEENCYALLKLLDPADKGQKIIMAELYRNLGEFGKCMELINSLPDSRFLGLKRAYENECKKENRLTFRVDYRDTN